jgi:hypothetical protein
MTRSCIITSLALLLLLSAMLVAQDDGGARYSYSLWLGTHYTDFNDNAKKVGEYNLGNDEILPEVKFQVDAVKGDRRFTTDLHYFDQKNVYAKLMGRVGNRVKADIRYRSLIHQQAQDMLVNMSVREWLSSAPGGKIITHEIEDPTADFNTHRNEIEANLEVLLSQKGNLRLVAAHRTIIETGTEQKIASNHCFSCHLQSKSVDVDKRTYIVKAGLEAEGEKVDGGYTFGYTKFHSKEAAPTAYYDEARHPVNGSNVEEFGSRVSYDDVTLPYALYPETEKMSHKARLGAQVGKGRLAASVTYSSAENKGAELTTDAISGAANYRVPLSPRSQLTAKASVLKLTADDPLIDLPTYREGRLGTPVDFDYTRYSALDRFELRGSAELTTKLSPKATLSVLGGYESIKRDDYPVMDDGLTTNRIIGQAKLRYRKGLRHSTNLKYRFEKTSDPFVSGRGLFERRGREELEINTPPGFAFYYQREDLRYQDITSQPTTEHIFEWSSSFRPTNKAAINLGLKGKYDKNGNLDSLDVKHLALQPNLAVTLTPEPRWTISGGYTFNYYKSRGPVAVALFDG